MKRRKVPVELILDERATLGEGPVWDDSRHVLFWVDISGKSVQQLDPTTGAVLAMDVGQAVGAIGLREAGGLVLAVEEGFALADFPGGPVETVARIRSEPGVSVRMNDGAVDPAGRFWAGTMAYDLTPKAAALYRFDPDGSIHTILDEVTISNGIGWSGDTRTMYYIDSVTYGVDAFDFDIDTGAVRNRRRVVDIPETAGMPDGMAIDAEGGLWICMWGGWSIHRYRPDGRLDVVVEIPVANVTSCTFGGPDLEDMFVTTARDGLNAEELADQVHAGGLFGFRPGVAGVATTRFAGGSRSTS